MVGGRFPEVVGGSGGQTNGRKMALRTAALKIEWGLFWPS